MKFMRWESKVANQMLSGLCLFKSTPSWMAPLAVLLLFSSYQLVGLGLFSVLFTSLAVLISTVLCIWKHKPVPVADKLIEETVLSSDEENSDETENIVPTQMHMNETVTEAKETQKEQDGDGGSATNSATSPNKLLESECHDRLSTSENPECSDGSISDEESLIEIAIPSGHFVGQHEEEPKYNCSLQQIKKRELPAESLFSRQQSLMEFLVEFNDMNEEENLIEIDISMGVIKCSRLEIEA